MQSGDGHGRGSQNSTRSSNLFFGPAITAELSFAIPMVMSPAEGAVVDSGLVRGTASQR